jgi:hypothetical protein
MLGRPPRLLGLNVVDRRQIVDPNANPVAHDANSHAAPVAAGHERLVDGPHAHEPARATANLVAVFRPSGRQIPRVEPNAGFGRRFRPDLDLQLEVPKIMPTDRPVIKQPRPRPAARQAPVFDPPRATVRRFPPLNRPPVKQRYPAASRLRPRGPANRGQTGHDDEKGHRRKKVTGIGLAQSAISLGRHRFNSSRFFRYHVGWPHSHPAAPLRQHAWPRSSNRDASCSSLARRACIT